MKQHHSWSKPMDNLFQQEYNVLFSCRPVTFLYSETGSDSCILAFDHLKLNTMISKPRTSVSFYNLVSPSVHNISRTESICFFVNTPTYQGTLWPAALTKQAWRGLFVLGALVGVFWREGVGTVTSLPHPPQLPSEMTHKLHACWLQYDIQSAEGSSCYQHETFLSLFSETTYIQKYLS